ncbi:MAG: hypothetical protein R2754_08695 [Microthrixaceae bacterium]
MHLAATLTIRRWDVATGDAESPHGAYAERFWLPVIGPSALWLLRWANSELTARGGAFDIGADELSIRLGLGAGTARQSPLRRSLKRLETFQLARRLNESVAEFRPGLAPLSLRQLSRLPVELRREHRAWLAQQAGLPATARSSDCLSNSRRCAPG